MDKKPQPNKEDELPWQKPKSTEEDPLALEEIKAIINSSSYILSEKDSEFIASDEVRGVRLQLDYLKAEIKMREYGIKHTVVVFGSARIIERSTALKRVLAASEALKSDPSSSELIAKLKASEKMLEKSFYYEEAHKFGQLVGKSGKNPNDCHITIMTGGGPGVMEAANRGAFDVGAKSIGLNIELPSEQFPNPYITPDLCFQFHYFAIRKLHFLRRAKALVVFPGGFGTMDELFEVLTLIQTQKNDPIPVVLVCKKYWGQVVDFEFLKEEGVIAQNDLDLFSFAENADEAWSKILAWHKERGTPLF